ncbi:MAG TPA: cation-transporting P-type ATPase, partial [Gemmatimonadaceae bacterium]|nr:cation-transporting P-type ATPase [Gemmatimonadaceae bacterium]
LNAAIGVTIELRARRALESLLALEVPRTIVLRDGAPVDAPARDLVAGDVIIIDEGRRVPADARLLDAAELSASEAILTGESEPVAKNADAPLPPDAPLAERATMLYQSTGVTRGRGQAVVVATGRATEVGRIESLVASVGELTTPLERRLAALGRGLAFGAVGAAAVVAIVARIGGGSFVAITELAIAVAVAAIPEGLPAISTIALAVGVRRMAHRKALVRRLPVVETLGSTTIICTDKTGTLTGGRMQATALWLDGEAREESAVPELDPAEVARGARPLAVALRTAALANRAHLGDESAVGDPTEIAILTLARAHGAERRSLRAAWPEVAEIPFSSERMLMATIHRAPDGSLVAFAKGAPSRILPRTDRLLTGGGDLPLGEGRRAALTAAAEDLGRRGLRVLALATGTVASPDDASLRGLTFVGLVGMSDPPAPGVPEALATLRDAGVHAVMLTGDQRRTAESVARELGLLEGGRRITDGPTIDGLDDAALDELLPELAGISRVSPAAKLRVVQAMQRRGEIVAMLGDGVNDAAALRRADVGVAMGGRGSDLAKEVAGVVLEDDRFETIVAATEEGRRIGANIRRAVFFIIACNLAELAVVLTAGAIGQPIPLTPLQILWLNLLTDTLPALALAVGPADPSLMQRPPRPPASPILSRRAISVALWYAASMTVGTLAAFELALRSGASLAAARTAAFFTLALTQVAQLANAYPALRRATRPGVTTGWLPVFGAVGLTIGLQTLPLIVPVFRRALEVVSPASATGWLTIVALSLAPVAAGCLARQLRLLFPRRTG